MCICIYRSSFNKTENEQTKTKSKTKQITHGFLHKEGQIRFVFLLGIFFMALWIYPAWEI